MSFFSNLNCGLGEKFVINGNPLTDNTTETDIDMEYHEEVPEEKPSLLLQIGAVGLGFFIGNKIGDQINKI